MDSYKLWIEALRWGALVAALTVGLWLLRELVRGERLSGLGWVVFLASVAAFFILLRSVQSPSDSETGRFLHIAESAEICRSPEAFIRAAPVRAQESCDALREMGVETSVTPEGLAGLTDWLKEDGRRVVREPELLDLAAAQFGEVLRLGLDGRWRVVSSRKGSQCVISLGRGRLRHDVSPGLLVVRAAEDPETRLEDIYIHERNEMS